MSVPNCPLLDDGICLIDLPGMNETDDMDQKVLALLKDVALTIFVMDAGQGLTNTGKKTLAALRDENVSAQAPVLFVANKIDQWQPSWGGPTKTQIEETKKKTLDALYKKLRDEMISLGPFPERETSPRFAAISAKEAGDAIKAATMARPPTLPVFLKDFVSFQRKLVGLLPERLNSAIEDAAMAICNQLNQWALLCVDIKAAELAVEACRDFQNRFSNPVEAGRVIGEIDDIMRTAVENVFARHTEELLDKAGKYELLNVDIAAGIISNEEEAWKQISSLTMGSFNEVLSEEFKTGWACFIEGFVKESLSQLSRINPEASESIHKIATTICGDIIREHTKLKPVTVVKEINSWWKRFLKLIHFTKRPNVKEIKWKHDAAQQIIKKNQGK